LFGFESQRTLAIMNDVTRLLDAIDAGDPRATDRLLPLVYNELRRLAAAQMAQEKPGQTLDATALVHEAYLRLVDERGARRVSEGAESRAYASGSAKQFANRRHFFAAAAQAMRRILVENARRKARHKHGGDLRRVDLDGKQFARGAGPEEVIAVDDALARLGEEDMAAAEVVQLHVFAGLSIEQAGEVLGIARATAYRHWTYARAWLRCELTGDSGSNS
jgi:RNA polymerase sigma factor (TIGR02999 family)